MSTRGPASVPARKMVRTHSYLSTPPLKNELDDVPPEARNFIKNKCLKLSKTHKEGGLYTFKIVPSELADKMSQKDVKAEEGKGIFIFTLKKSRCDPFECRVIVPAVRAEKVASSIFILKEKEMIGRGAFGIVFKALDMINNKIVACKYSSHNGALADSQDILQERTNLSLLDRCLGFYTNRQADSMEEWTFMNYYPGKSLKDHLYGSSNGSESDLKNEYSFLHQIALCIEIVKEVISIHEHGLIFRDLKPENIRFHQSNHPDIFSLITVDLGSAMPIEIAKNYNCLDGTTPGYVAPEMGLTSDKRPGFSKSQDYFALGVILAQILSKHNYEHLVSEKIKEIMRAERFQRPLTHNEINQMMPDILKVNARESLSFLTHESSAIKSKSIKQPEETAGRLFFQFTNFIQQLTAPLSERIAEDAFIHTFSELRNNYARYALSRRAHEIVNPKSSLNTLSTYIENRRRNTMRISPMPTGGTFNRDTFHMALKAGREGDNDAKSVILIENEDEKSTEKPFESQESQSQMALLEDNLGLLSVSEKSQHENDDAATEWVVECSVPTHFDELPSVSSQLIRRMKDLDELIAVLPTFKLDELNLNLQSKAIAHQLSIARHHNKGELDKVLEDAEKLLRQDATFTYGIDLLNKCKLHLHRQK